MKKNKLIVLSFSLVFAMLFPACSSDGDPTPSVAPVSDETDFMTRFSTLACQYEEKCCKFATKNIDHSLCEESYTSFLKVGANRKKQENYIFDQQLATQSLSEMKAKLDQYSCGDSEFWIIDYLDPYRPKVLKKLSESCNLSNDCEQTAEGKVHCAYSFSSESQEQLVCKQTLPGKEGKPCDVANPVMYDCQTDPDLYCDFETQVCKKRLDIGTKCYFSENCKAGLYCAKDETYSYTCKPLLTIGENCDSKSYVDSCEANSYCDFMTKKCKAKKEIGETCKSTIECSNSYCEMYSNTCKVRFSGYCTQ
jgi:hypothetical protein